MNLLRLKSSSYVRAFSNGRCRWNLVAYSTGEPLPYFQPSSSSSASKSTNSLTSRISRDASAGKVREILDKWAGEGNVITLVNLRLIIKRLRSKRRFEHALQVSEWMSDQHNHELTSSDFAVRLDLVDKVSGLKEAEKYIHDIPEASRGFMAYGALLNCYARRKHVKEAEAVLQKLREMGTLRRPLCYNVMLNVYAKTRKFDKMDALMEEMQGKGIDWDSYTYNFRMNACVAQSDIEGMEKLLLKMEADPNVKISWNSYVAAAHGYLNSGQTEAASTMLKRMERLLSDNAHKHGYGYLISFYAAMGSKDEVYRIWDLYKRQRKFSNGGYLAMISSLVKLGDIAGAENIIEEWGYGKPAFDIRIPKALIVAYCRRGLIEKAEAYLSRLSQRRDQKELEALKEAISGCSKELEQNTDTLEASLDYLQGDGDGDQDEELRVST